MSGRFDYFVVFAGMRTGSNFLESNLNALDGLTCHGEAYNPAFPGQPKADACLGVTLEQREASPTTLLDAVENAPGMNGFRYFSDHDPRVLEPILDNPRCAKIILTRNPVDSYVSLKIARATGQWLLTDHKSRKSGMAVFDGEEFENYVADQQAFQLKLLKHLQRTGQTAFYLNYEDLRDLDAINGLAAFLGVSDRLNRLDNHLKVQNPARLEDKVENFDEMAAALAKFDWSDLNRTPHFEPRRSPSVRNYCVGRDVPLVFMPVPGNPSLSIENWLAAIQGGGDDALIRDMNQKELRAWKNGHHSHRSFAVVRHPLVRAHHVFCETVLNAGPDGAPRLRRHLVQSYKIELPDMNPGPDWTLDMHRAAFAAFLKFLKGALANQTSIRLDPSWATQSEILQGFARFAVPDHVFREEELAMELPRLAKTLGDVSAEKPDLLAEDTPFTLSEVCTDALEKLCQNAYMRDYSMFGFGKWSTGGLF